MQKGIALIDRGKTSKNSAFLFRVDEANFQGKRNERRDEVRQEGIFRFALFLPFFNKQHLFVLGMNSVWVAIRVSFFLNFSIVSMAVRSAIWWFHNSIAIKSIWMLYSVNSIGFKLSLKNNEKKINHINLKIDYCTPQRERGSRGDGRGQVTSRIDQWH